MMSTEEMIRSSQCFGVAFDATVPECKQCDVHLRCEHKCRLNWMREGYNRPIPTMMVDPGDMLDEPLILDEESAFEELQHTSSKSPSMPTNKNIPKPTKPLQSPGIPKKTVKEAIKTKNYDPNMPEFKGLTIKQMEDMVVERGGNLADFDKYKVDNIRRMRLTMFLKKTYEI